MRNPLPLLAVLVALLLAGCPAGGGPLSPGAPGSNVPGTSTDQTSVITNSQTLFVTNTVVVVRTNSQTNFAVVTNTYTNFSTNQVTNYVTNTVVLSNQISFSLTSDYEKGDVLTISTSNGIPVRWGIRVENATNHQVLLDQEFVYSTAGTKSITLLTNFDLASCSVYVFGTKVKDFSMDKVYFSRNSSGRSINFKTARQVIVTGAVGASGSIEIEAETITVAAGATLTASRLTRSTNLSGGNGAGNCGGGGGGGALFNRGTDGGTGSDYNPGWNPNRPGIASSNTETLIPELQMIAGGDGGAGGGNGYQGYGGAGGGPIRLKASVIRIYGQVSTRGGDGGGAGYDDGGGGAGAPGSLTLDSPMIYVSPQAVVFCGGRPGAGSTYGSWTGGTGGFAGLGVVKLRNNVVVIDDHGNVITGQDQISQLVLANTYFVYKQASDPRTGTANTTSYFY